MNLMIASCCASRRPAGPDSSTGPQPAAEHPAGSPLRGLPPWQGDRLRSALLVKGSPEEQSLPDAAEPQAASRAAPSASKRLNLRRIAESGFVSMMAQGAWFGSTFGLAGYLRAVGSPPVKVAAGGLAVLGGFLTAPTEDWLRRRFEVPASVPAQPSLAFDFIASVVLLTNSACYQFSRLPKFPSNSARGALVTAFLSGSGTFMAGATREAIAQNSHRRTGQEPPSVPGAGDPWRVACGRALSLLPYFIHQQYVAAQATYQSLQPPRAPGRLPPPATTRSKLIALQPMFLACFGWGFQRRLTPPGNEGSSSHPAKALRRDDVQQP